MTQSLIDRQDIVKTLPVTIDDIAERHDEIQFRRVEHGDGLGKLGEAAAIMAVHRLVRRDIGILRIGDDAEAENGHFGVVLHGACLEPACNNCVTFARQKGRPQAVKGL